MTQVLLCSGLLVAGLVVSQLADLSSLRTALSTVTMVCLAYIMIEVGLDTLGTAIAEIEREAVNQEQVIGALQQVSQVFETLPPALQTTRAESLDGENIRSGLFEWLPECPGLRTPPH